MWCSERAISTILQSPFQSTTNSQFSDCDIKMSIDESMASFVQQKSNRNNTLRQIYVSLRKNLMTLFNKYLVIASEMRNISRLQFWYSTSCAITAWSIATTNEYGHHPYLQMTWNFNVIRSISFCDVGVVIFPIWLLHQLEQRLPRGSSEWLYSIQRRHFKAGITKENLWKIMHQRGHHYTVFLSCTMNLLLLSLIICELTWNMKVAQDGIFSDAIFRNQGVLEYLSIEEQCHFSLVTTYPDSTYGLRVLVNYARVHEIAILPTQEKGKSKVYQRHFFPSRVRIWYR